MLRLVSSASRPSCKRGVTLSFAPLWVVVGRTAIVSSSSPAVLRAEQAQHSYTLHVPCNANPSHPGGPLLYLIHYFESGPSTSHVVL